MSITDPKTREYVLSTFGRRIQVANPEQTSENPRGRGGSLKRWFLSTNRRVRRYKKRHFSHTNG